MQVSDRCNLHDNVERLLYQALDAAVTQSAEDPQRLRELPAPSRGIRLLATLGQKIAQRGL